MSKTNRKPGSKKHDPERKSLPAYHFSRGRRTWARKFSDAFSGLYEAVHRQSSYLAHFTATVAVIFSAWFLGNFDAVRWSILMICIFVVIAAEMFNTALESLARAVTSAYNPFIRRSLNIASGAVLTIAFGTAIVGMILFAESLYRLFH